MVTDFSHRLALVKSTESCDLLQLKAGFKPSCGNTSSEALGRVLDFVLECLCHFSIGNMGFVSILIKTVLLYM